MDPASRLRSKPTTRNAEWASIVGYLNLSNLNGKSAASTPRDLFSTNLFGSHKSASASLETPYSASHHLPTNGDPHAPSRPAHVDLGPVLYHTQPPSNNNGSSNHGLSSGTPKLPKIPPIFSFLPPPALASIEPSIRDSARRGRKTPPGDLEAGRGVQP